MRLAPLLLLAASPAAAQVSEEILRDTAGEHIILPVDGRPGCRIRLGLGIAIGGRSATPSPECARRVPKAADAAAWVLMDGITLIDPLRRTVMRFEEDETALPISPSLMNPRYYLIPALPGLTRAPTMANSAGDWIATRGKQSCRLTLGAKGTAIVPPACAPIGLKPVLRRWTIEGINLLFSGPNDAEADFEITGDDTFREFTRPIRLRRVR